MADDDALRSAAALGDVLDDLADRTAELAQGARGFAGAMTAAFNQAIAGGRRFDDVMKSLLLRLSSRAVAQALRPLTQGLSGALDSLFAGTATGMSGGGIAAALGAVKPFAAGGVIGTPTWFPLEGGGVGLAGESGPEAILPLARAADGRLGVVAAGGGTTTINVHIVTQDAASFRRSETYVAGQIARAVARGQRSL